MFDVWYRVFLRQSSWISNRRAAVPVFPFVVFKLIQYLLLFNIASKAHCRSNTCEASIASPLPQHTCEASIASPLPQNDACSCWDIALSSSDSLFCTMNIILGSATNVILLCASRALYSRNLISQPSISDTNIIILSIDC